MPKIIKNIENTIRTSATQLFIELGYTYVDMRMIAKKSGIAVGTLYNYYENKKQLYIRILNESWQKTFERMEQLKTEKLSIPEAVKCMVTILYEDIEARNGIGRDLINPSEHELKNDVEVIQLKNKLLTSTMSFITPITKSDDLENCPEVDVRLAESLLMTILAMYQLHPEKKDDNIQFIFTFISLSMKLYVS